MGDRRSPIRGSYKGFGALAYAVEGQYVLIGVLDAGDNDKANFSRSEQTFTSCNGENPTLDVVEGKGFVVKEDI